MKNISMMIAGLVVSFGLCGMAEAAPKKVTLTKTKTCKKDKTVLSFTGKNDRQVKFGKVDHDSGKKKRGVRFVGKNDGKLSIGGVNKANGTKKRGVHWKSPEGNIKEFGVHKKYDGTLRIGFRSR